MTQASLNRSVARATGESLDTVRRRGFSIADPAAANFDPEPYQPPAMLDWDAMDANRLAILPNRSAPTPHSGLMYRIILRRSPGKGDSRWRLCSRNPERIRSWRVYSS